jgi:hypothetical protein
MNASGALQERQSGQPGPFLALTALILAVAVYLFDILLMVQESVRSDLQPGVVVQALENLALLVAVIVGYLILRAQPGNRVGWCMMAAGESFLITSLAGQLAAYGYHTWGETGLTLFAGWVAQWAWIGSQLAGPFMILYYPTGRLPSRGWRPVLWFFWFVVGLAFFAYAFAADPTLPAWVPHSAGIDLGNPFSSGSVGGLSQSLIPLSQVLMMSLNVIAGVSLVFRYRTASATARSQIKVITVMAVLSLVGLIGLQPLEVSPTMAALLNIGIVALTGGTIGLAITRYRLFDMDRLVSRTITYSLVVAGLSIVYFTVVTTATGLLPSQNSLVVAGTTLLVAALFNPLRNRVQQWVDMRFNRSHYDAQRVLDALSSGLANDVETETVAERFVDAVVEAIEPEAVGVWVAGSNQSDSDVSSSAARTA